MNDDAAIEEARSRTRQRFGVVALVVGLLGVLVFVWLGPVFLLGVQATGFLAGVVFLSVLLLYLALNFVGSVQGLLAVLLGVLPVALIACLLALVPPLRMTYARLRPAPSLAYDFRHVADVLHAAERPPADLAALVVAMRAAGEEPSFSTFRDGLWFDPFGRPMHYAVKRRPFGLPAKVELYSLGRNGRDEAGAGDDLTYETLARRWLRRGQAALDLLERVRK